MSTHYCEIHASGRIYNPPLLILRSATPLVLRLAVVRIYMPHPFPTCGPRPFPTYAFRLFQLAGSSLPNLRALLFSGLWILALTGLRAPAFSVPRSTVLSVLQSTVLSVLRSLILSVCVSSSYDSAISVLCFRLLRFCGFEFQICGFRSLSGLQISTPPGFEGFSFFEPQLPPLKNQRYCSDMTSDRTYKCFT